MDHEEATRLQAPERYLVGDLSAPEREEFEDHFFSCFECAEALKTGAIFAENARSVFREQIRRPTATSPAEQPQPGMGWWNWLRPSIAAPALAALLLVIGYQNLVIIPRLDSQLAEASAPQGVASFPLKLARGDDTVVVPPSSRSFTLYFHLPQGGSFQGYVCQIETGAGVLKRRIAVLAPQAGQPVTILLQRSGFPTGPYVVKVLAPDSGSEIATYHFTLNTD